MPLICTSRGARSRGFTLIELLISTTIVTLLLAIAIPLWHDIRERGFVTGMRSDLRNVAVMQESYFYDHSAYTPSVSVLSGMGLTLSPGVQIQVHEATRLGWSVSASHEATLRQCYLFVGFAAPVGSASESGSTDCG
jgi:prepilin-type N-terminal cleavage/methylation domain-containing protein